MTITTQGFQAVFPGNGSATTFSFSFAVPDPGSLTVIYTDANGNAQTLSPSLYTVVFGAGNIGGLVTYPLSGSPIASGTSLLVARETPLEQPTSLENQGALWPAAVEGALDNIEAQLQEIAGGGAGAGVPVLFPAVDVNPTNTLPPAAARALKYFGFDSSGNPAMLSSSAAQFLMLNVKDFGAVGNGSHDDFVAITAAITAAASAGSGVYFPPGNYKHGTQLTLKSGVTLWGVNGAALTYSGSNTVAQITSPTSGCLIEAGIVALNLNSGTAVKSIELFSPWRCTLSDITIATNNASSFVIDFLCNSSGSTNPDGNYNSVFNYTTNILQTGTCGTFVRLRGNGVDAPSQVVTLNTFASLNALGCCVRGVDFSQYCDSNTFVGMVRLAIIASNGFGVEWNTANPSVNLGVYANKFDHLAVDTFAIGGVSGRIGLVMNETKYVSINFYYNSPVAENGSYFITSNCHSYDFMLVQDEDNGDGLTNVMRRVTNASIKSGGDGASADMDIGTDFDSVNNLRFFGGGYVQMRVRHDNAAVNWWDIFGNATGQSVILRAEGSDTNIGTVFASKGTGDLAFCTNQNVGGKNIALKLSHTANGVNFWQLFEGATGTDLVCRAAGDDTNINLSLQAKGSGVIVLGSDSAPQAKVLNVGGTASNHVPVLSASASGNPSISVSGGELAVGTNAWTFGVANAVAPTSPNRTLTITIGATTFYIAAKTTND